MVFAEQFLEYPDLFPARPSGEPWGEGCVRIDLCGGRYLARGLSVEQQRALLERYRELCTGGGASFTEASGAAVNLELFRVDASDFRSFDTRGWHHEIDFEHAPEGVRFAGLDLMALLDWADPEEPGLLRGALFTPAACGHEFLGAFENFFRVMVAYRLLDRGGVLLHSAGVVTAGEAYLFLGPSGAGKTTVSRLSLERGHEVLSDDVNALLGGPAAGSPSSVWAAKLPFAGDLGHLPGGLGLRPVHGLYRLKQASEHRLVALSPGHALALLVACAPFVNADPHRSQRLVDLLSGFAAAVPAYRLEFRRDAGFWPLLEARSGLADPAGATGEEIEA